jgi:hypothetical protein
MIESQLPLTLEEQSVAEKHGIKDKISKNMAHTFFSVNKLREEYEKENAFKYDLVLVTRPDIIFYRELDLSRIYKDFSSDEIKNTLFFTDILCLETPDYCTNFKTVIRGIDLFLLASGDVVSTIACKWYGEKRYLTEYGAERNIARIINEQNIYLQLWQYPKCYCWNIKRTNEIADKWFVKCFVVLLNILADLLEPLLIYSTHYQRRTFRGGYHVLRFSKKWAGRIIGRIKK